MAPKQNRKSTQPPRVRHRANLTSTSSRLALEPNLTDSKELKERLAQEIVMRDPRALKPHPNNARKHPKKQLKQLCKSFIQFGVNVPVLINADGRILAGHARVEAAKKLDLKEIPTIEVRHLSEAEQRAFMLADNRIAENAEWDLEILSQEISLLTSPEINLDIASFGFDSAEIEGILGSAEPEGEPYAWDEEEEIAPPDMTVSRRDDLWFLRNHRLLCGDALLAASYERLMAGHEAQGVFSDPPYNVPIDGHVSGLGETKHREFLMASGELAGPQFRGFLTKALTRIAAVCVNGALLYICMDWRGYPFLLEAARDVGLKQVNLVVWRKANGGMGSMYRSQHELIPVFKNGDAPHVNNVQLGKHGRNRTNVWDYAGVNSFREGRQEELAAHPTPKPVQMVADAIQDSTKRNAIVLDPFVGSGTTILAAERTQRRAFTMELAPEFVDVAVERWQDYTGEAAVLQETGQTFDQVRDARLGEGASLEAFRQKSRRSRP